MYETDTLGQTEVSFPLNAEEWERSLLACGSMIFFGIVGSILGIYRTYSSGEVSWILLLSSLALTIVAAYVLMMLRPKLLSIDICERGLRTHEREGTVEFPWDSIMLIECSTLDADHKHPIQQVFIQREDESGLVANDLVIADFPRFMERLEELASEHDIPMRSA